MVVVVVVVTATTVREARGSIMDPSDTLIIIVPFYHLPDFMGLGD